MGSRICAPTTVLTLLAVLLACGTLSAAPAIKNASFEADRYTVYPGYRGGNGGAIVGWQGSGQVGINPIWKAPQKQLGGTSPFHDNGKVPHGRQIALIQGAGKLSQRIPGFQKGQRYRVEYRENARIQKPPNTTAWPIVEVSLGGEIIVSAHEVMPVAPKDDFSAPFCRVVSAEFTPPEDGAYELTITTSQPNGSTILLDHIRIIEK